jgi:hypothetical protein
LLARQKPVPYRSEPAPLKRKDDEDEDSTAPVDSGDETETEQDSVAEEHNESAAEEAAESVTEEEPTSASTKGSAATERRNPYLSRKQQQKGEAAPAEDAEEDAPLVEEDGEAAEDPTKPSATVPAVKKWTMRSKMESHAQASKSQSEDDQQATTTEPTSTGGIYTRRNSGRLGVSIGPKAALPSSTRVALSAREAAGGEASQTLKQSGRDPVRLSSPPPSLLTATKTSESKVVSDGQHSNAMGANGDEFSGLSEECQVYVNINAPDQLPRYDESFERVKGLILCGIPFAIAKYDHENVILAGKDYHIHKRTGIQHPMPLRPHETSYQILRIDLIDSLKHSKRNYFYALPLPPCLEGYDCKYLECEYLEEEPAGGGNVNRAVTMLGNLKYQKMGWVTYSSLFTRRNYEEAKAFFLGLLTGPDSERVNMLAFEKSLVEGLSWAGVSSRPTHHVLCICNSTTLSATQHV